MIILSITPGGCALASGCGRNADGYPQLKCGGRARGLHAVVFESLHGPLAAGMVVRHTCDTPNCVSPAHLIAGTHAQNVADRVARGRSAKGSGHGRAKLDEGKVLAMRASAETDAHFARLWGIDPRAVARARSGQTWKHVPVPGSPTPAVAEVGGPTGATEVPAALAA